MKIGKLNEFFDINCRLTAADRKETPAGEADAKIALYRIEVIE